MNSPGNSNFHTLQNLKQLRLAGDPGPALQAASQALAGPSVDPAVLAECVRILIVVESTDMAVKLYTLLTNNSQPENNLEPEALVRLALQMGRTDLLQGMPVPEGPRWLVALLENGEEPAEMLEISDLQVRSDNGPSVYFFTGTCPYCGHMGSATIATNLLTVHQATCRACFGRFVLDYVGIGNFLRRRFPDFLDLDVSQTDWDLIDHIRPRMIGNEPAPEVMLNLGQEYQFLLNEVLARQLMTAADAPGETRI